MVMMNKQIQDWESKLRNQSIEYKRSNMPCGYGARYNGATVRDEVQNKYARL